METVNRAALGSTASLGDMYDARSDGFCGTSALKRHIPDTARVFVENSFSDVQYVYSDKMSEKFSKLNVNAELQVSCLMGALTLSGSGSFISNTKASARSVQSSLLYNIKTKDERVNIFHEDMRDVFSLDAINSNLGCTHIVTEIQWGANSMLTCHYENEENENVKDISGSLHAKLEKIAFSISGSANVKVNEGDNNHNKKFTFRLFGDVIPDDEMPTTVEQAIGLMKRVPKLLQTTNQGLGKPLAFKLVPISVVQEYLRIELCANIIFKTVEATTLTKVVQFFEELQHTQQLLYDFCTDVKNFEYCLKPDESTSVLALKTDVAIYEATARSKLGTILKDVRSGKVHTQILDDSLGEFHNMEMSPSNVWKKIKAWNGIQNKISFSRSVQNKGAIYIGSTRTLQEEILENDEAEMVVLYIQPDSPLQDATRWNENSQIFFHSLKQKNENQKYFVVDCNFHPSTLTESSIIQVLQKGMLVVPDLLEEHKTFQGRSLMDWTIPPTKTVTTPTDLVEFKSACAGKTCNGKNTFTWICRRCAEVVKFGADNFCYCNCGRSSTDCSQFKCSDPKHGLQFYQHERQYMLDLMSKLRPKPKSQIKWVAPVNGCLPNGALEAGYEAGGYVSYILRANHEGGVCVGRLTRGLPGARYPGLHARYSYGGKEHTASQYEVLVAPPSAVKWEVHFGNRTHPGAVETGLCPYWKVPYLVGRMARKNDLVPGKINQNKNETAWCWVAQDGLEVRGTIYEVLIDLSAL